MTHEADPSVRVRLDVCYDGTQFSGWAAQPGRRTVQSTLEQALATVLRVPAVAVTVAGRTDAGVHATGQVAHLDLAATTWVAAAHRLVRSVNAVLPADVRVSHAIEVPPSFDARFAALWRRYEYRLCDQPGGVDPLRRYHVVHRHRRLDVDAMSTAAGQLVGLHDFAAFCRRREGATTVRDLQLCQVARDGAEIVCTLQADAFCHSMVRSVVGALLAVGEGRRPVAWPAGLLALSARAEDVSVAPARGLTLVGVGYPRDDELAARVVQTRARRPTPGG